MANPLRRLNLELSAHCSYACVGCPNTYMKRSKGYMSPELYKNVFDEIDGTVETVFLWNYGEPLLNPSVGSLISYAAARSPRTILSSTGYPLSTMHSVEELALLDELIISINGFDKKTYAFHQKKGDLEKVLKGLERIKHVMRYSETEYTLQTVVNNRNIMQVGLVDEFARRYGFKKVLLKSFNVMDGKDETRKRFLPDEEYYSREHSAERREEFPCLDWMVINWNGDVNLCCWDYEGEVIPGNVFSQGVFGVWNSDTMEKFKIQINQGNYMSFCVDCLAKTTITEWTIE